MSNFNDADLFAWVYALTRIEPGDFATRRQEDSEAILARNVACTPVVAVHCEKEWIGADNGETGV